jgi:hypothetical protein
VVDSWWKEVIRAILLALFIPSNAWAVCCLNKCPMNSLLHQIAIINDGKNWETLNESDYPEVNLFIRDNLSHGSSFVFGKNCDMALFSSHQKYNDKGVLIGPFSIGPKPKDKSDRPLRASEFKEVYPETTSVSNDRGHDLVISQLSSSPTKKCQGTFEIASEKTIEKLPEQGEFEVLLIAYQSDGKNPDGSIKAPKKRIQYCKAQRPTFAGAISYKNSNVLLADCDSSLFNGASGGVIAVPNEMSDRFTVIGLLTAFYSIKPERDGLKFQPYAEPKDGKPPAATVLTLLNSKAIGIIRSEAPESLEKSFTKVVVSK